MLIKKEKIMGASHAGFSLIAVLIISLIGMALIGVTFYIYESSVGQGAITMQRSLEYNALQDALEQGKSVLVNLLNNTNPVPRWYNNSAVGSGDMIKNPDMLLIEGGTFDNTVKLDGRTGQIKVEIFDLLYEESQVDTAALGALASKMPPAMKLTELGRSGHQSAAPNAPGKSTTSDQMGIYLIRATLTIGGETKILESSVIQRNGAISSAGGGAGGNVNPGGP